MRIAVIGAGAMGSLATYLLQAAGAEVVLYERRAERLRFLRAEGVVLRGAVEGRCAPEVGEEGGAAAPYDALVLAVEAGKTGEALRPLSPFVHRDSIYLSLQDGFAAAELASLVGAERTVVALPWVSAEESATGVVEVEGMRELRVGPFAERNVGGWEDLASALARACPCGVKAVSDIAGSAWERLQCAAAVSGICAVSGMMPAEARADGRLDALCAEAAEECRGAAAVAGVELPRPGSAWEEAVWEDLRPPMQRRAEAGETTEVAWMSGRVVEATRGSGTAVPVHAALLTLIKEIEGGRHRPGEVAVRELLRRVEEEKGMSLR